MGPGDGRGEVAGSMGEVMLAGRCSPPIGLGEVTPKLPGLGWPDMWGDMDWMGCGDWAMWMGL